MGTLRSKINHSGLSINGITLGEPFQETDENGEVIEGSLFFWDDSRLPTGVIEEDESITPDDTIEDMESI
jgi:hypothetical protein